MVKKTITYEDFNGEKQTEDFYFNLTEAEAAELEVSVDGGFSAFLQRTVEQKNSKNIIEVFKMMILRAYGEKTADGRGFKKSSEISEAFASSPAYSELFMELATNEQAATDFFQNLMPKVKDRQITTANDPKNGIPSLQGHLRKQN